jgi:hypothetical protein
MRSLLLTPRLSSLAVGQWLPSARTAQTWTAKAGWWGAFDHLDRPASRAPPPFSLAVPWRVPKLPRASIESRRRTRGAAAPRLEVQGSRKFQPIQYGREPVLGLPRWAFLDSTLNKDRCGGACLPHVVGAPMRRPPRVLRTAWRGFRGPWRPAPMDPGRRVRRDTLGAVRSFRGASVGGSPVGDYLRSAGGSEGAPTREPLPPLQAVSSDGGTTACVRVRRARLRVPR